MSSICAWSFSTWLRMKAAYWAFAGLGWAGAGTGLLLGSPTTETVPFAPETVSLVQTFLGFGASAGGAESCDCAAGAGELVTGDCAGAERAAKKVKIKTNESGRD